MCNFHFDWGGATGWSSHMAWHWGSCRVCTLEVNDWIINHSPMSWGGGSSLVGLHEGLININHKTLCNEITVKLRILSTSYRGQSILTVVVQSALIPIAIRRYSPRGSVSMLVDNGLLGGNRGDDGLGTCQHGDQCSGCPPSTPNLAQL